MMNEPVRACAREGSQFENTNRIKHLIRFAAKCARERQGRGKVLAQHRMGEARYTR